MDGKAIYTQFRELAPEQRRRALLLGCEMALSVWNNYTEAQGSIIYNDTVVGMQHQVDIALPSRTIDWLWLWCKNGEADPNAQSELWGAYVEPIVALRDSDWELPIDVEYAYYAIYNFLKMVQESDFTTDADYRIFNQIIASQLGQDQRDGAKIQAAMLAWWTKVVQA